MSQPNEVYPNLFVGGQETTLDYLTKRGIRQIVCLEPSIFDRYKGRVAYTNFVVEDTPQQSLDSLMPAIEKAIDDALSKGPSLVQCRAGVSRSATAAMCFIFKRENCGQRRKTPATLLSVVTSVKQARVVAKPNIGFFRYLLKVEKQVLGSNSMGEEDYHLL
ncbi:putative tyrosine phosphatase 123R [Diplonema papillatum]|nr:putative tyrosine phosphatase 123R [Diplonema papillatum]